MYILGKIKTNERTSGWYRAYLNETRLVNVSIGDYTGHEGKCFTRQGDRSTCSLMVKL